MILELHLLQSFAPSNLNRDENGSPKECIFGGVRRARISSQCFKRAMRDYFRPRFAKQNLAERTVQLVDHISDQLKALGKDKGEAARVVENLIGGLGWAMSSKHPGQTEYLLFLGREEIQKISAICYEHYESLLEIKLNKEEGESKKDAKKAKKSAVPPEITKKVTEALDGGKAADLGLFGRLLADLPKRSREAASQIAHAISTHAVELEDDFFTAVDDLAKNREVEVEHKGSSHLGTVEFNSACFYRYANVNVDLLRKNLQGDEDLTRATVAAYIRAAVEALPTGKQNSFATHEKPSMVYAVVRDAGMLSLANAFEKPVWNNGGGLVDDSIKRLSDHYGAVTGVYGDAAVSRAYVKTSPQADASALGDDAGSFDALLDRTMAAIFGGKEA